jgi:hypothetical protein
MSSLANPNSAPPRDNVLGKLGVSNRAGIAAWVTKNLFFKIGTAIPAFEVLALVG